MTKSEMTIISGISKCKNMECYGLKLLKKLDGSLKLGSMYVTLTRMENKGLLTSVKESESTGRGLPKVTYKLTRLAVNKFNEELDFYLSLNRI